MPEIVVTEFMDADAVRQLETTHETLYDPGLVDRPETLAEAVRDARAVVVRNRTQVRPDLLAQAPRLECVGRLGVGLDNIDMEACKAGGIAVYPATGANDLAVAEYVIVTAMALLRPAFNAKEAMLNGEWPRQRLIGAELAGRIMGLIGYGSIAREVARRAASLGMKVVAADPYVAPDDAAWQLAESALIEEVLSRADVISLHVPLNDTTRNLIDAAALTRMKPDAVLVNAARGGIVDEAALADALKTGKLTGAALDVFETEPLTADAAAKFRGVDNLILTPHIAGVTVESNVRVSALIAKRICNHLKGQT
jgi:(S)-sulfolactate dehydrogenase